MAEFVMKDLAMKRGYVVAGPRDAGAAEADFVIASAATSTEELGNGVYPPAKRKLAAHGIGTAGNDLGVSRHRAHQITRAEYDAYDLVICMDENNLRNLKRGLRIPDAEWAAARTASDPAGNGMPRTGKSTPRTDALPKVSLLLEYAPEEYLAGRSRWDGLEVADPWYTGNFDATWNDVVTGCQGLLDKLR